MLPSRLVLVPILRAILTNDEKGLRDPKSLLSPVARMYLDQVGEEEVLAFINDLLLTELPKYLPKYKAELEGITKDNIFNSSQPAQPEEEPLVAEPPTVKVFQNPFGSLVE